MRTIHISAGAGRFVAAAVDDSVANQLVYECFVQSIVSRGAPKAVGDGEILVVESEYDGGAAEVLSLSDLVEFDRKHR